MRRLSLLVAASAWLWGGAALAVTTEDFIIANTQDVIDVCTTPESDPMYGPAMGFCQGYLVGAYQYHAALHSGPKARPIVCLPQPTPTRSQAIDRFIVWAKAHPEYANEKPVEALVKFLVETYPCTQGAPAAK
ncbi:MAG: Rap1a/Tai family immunity protein [Thermodesulfobacteriota bacterium]